MTTAVCFKCGEFKFGAWTPCNQCGAFPEIEEDFVISLAMTDHYFDEATLKQMGDSVKDGRPPHLDERSRAALVLQFRAASKVTNFTKMAADMRAAIQARKKHDPEMDQSPDLDADPPPPDL